MSKEPLEDSYIDEDTFFDNRREVKKLKKIKSKIDRSKLKTSNLNKEIISKSEDDKPLNLPKGRVIKTLGATYTVYFE